MESMKNRMTATMTSQDSSQTEKYDCAKCKDLGWVVDGWTARECSCLEIKRYQARVRGAMIPQEFKETRLETFEIRQPIHKKMLAEARRYLDEFDSIQKSDDSLGNSLGFVAEFGESRIAAISDPRRRSEVKKKYNSYGLGKTHLQVGIAKEILKRGTAVLVVSDAIIMDELMMFKNSDNKELYFKKLGTLIEIPVLVWDDLGKSNSSEAKRAMYYQIINERWKRQNPVIFSSNEDMQTLEMKIGGAAMSRLADMTWGRIVKCSGMDARIHR